MLMKVFNFIDQQQSARVFNDELLPYCELQWACGKGRLRVSVMEEDELRHLQQNAYYWGVVLKQIAEQAKSDGKGFLPPAWHWYFKHRLLRPTTKFMSVPGVGVMTETIPPSTKTLSVKKMNDYLNEVEAIATTELGVVFSDNRSWEDFFDGVTI